MGSTAQPPDNITEQTDPEAKESEQDPVASVEESGTASKSPMLSKTKLKRWSVPRKVIVFSSVGLFLLTLAIISPLLYRHYTAEYSQDKAAAQSGVHHLQAAEGFLKGITHGVLDIHSITQAHQEFAYAYTAFRQVQNDAEQIPDIASNIPRYGNLISSAQKLIPLAVEAAQAGMIGCDALNIVVANLHGTLGGGSQHLTQKNLTSIKNDVTRVQAILNSVTGQIKQLQPADLQLDARLGPAVAAFRSQGSLIATSLQDMQSLLSVAPALLGTGQPAAYLIEQLDSTELRPGGGFIGNYGIATFTGGQLAGIHMQDTYLLDNAYQAAGHSTPLPAEYSWYTLAPTYTLRDSNLDADFPTVARYGEQQYHTEGGNVALQGVIAITPWFIQNALKITGPIAVPEYNETITAQNLVDRIHYYQLQEAALKAGDVPSPDGHSSLRKRFTEILFEHFFERLRQVAPTAMPQIFSLLTSSLHTKDLQIYLNPPAGEKLLLQYHLAADIQAPAGDSLMVVDANIQSNKANYFMTYTLQDQITLDSAGNATHHTVLTYNWPQSQANQQNDYGHTDAYTDYVRVYIPSGSTIQAQSGWEPKGTSTAFKREVVAGLFTLPAGQTGVIDLTWTVHAAASHDAHGWHYHYLLQKQAGITWKLNIPLKLPACSRNVQSTNKAAFEHGQSGSIQQALTTDLNIDVNYTC